MKSSESEIGLEFETKKCFVVSILQILLRLKLTNKTGKDIWQLSIFFRIGRSGFFVLSMNAKVSFVDKLFGKVKGLQSEEV